MSVVTPVQVEARLKELSKLIDQAHDDLVHAESLYHQNKASYEIAIASSRLSLANKSSPSGRNYTVGERDDMALLENRDLHRIVAGDEAIVKANRANVARLRVQVDITRSISSSIKATLDL